MGLKRAAALLHGALAAGVILFQVALAAGVPSGAYAKGRRVSGTIVDRRTAIWHHYYAI
jgi:hypothetical protein